MDHISKDSRIISEQNMYLILNCPSCGRIIMANTINRTKTCIYCGAKIAIFNANILAKSNSTQEALDIIQQLKQDKNEDSNQIIFKKFKDRSTESF